MPRVAAGAVDVAGASDEQCRCRRSGGCEAEVVVVALAVTLFPAPLAAVVVVFVLLRRLGSL